MYFLLLFILLINYSYQSTILCPNDCNGNGICTTGAAGHCECYLGYEGYDCSTMLCPKDYPWFDSPSSNNTARTHKIECSGMGHCDTSTGKCQCRPGYYGAACEQLSVCGYLDYRTCIDKTGSRFCGAKAVCSGNGQCMSLRFASIHYQQLNNNQIITPYNNWDADRITGCICDDGYEGFQCQYKSCPKGDDPSTAGVSEIQGIDCQCDHCNTTDGIYLTIHGITTDLIPYSATKELVSYYIAKSKAMEQFSLHMSGGHQLCTATGTTTILTYLLPQHTPPPMRVTSSSSTSGSPTILHVFTGGASSILNTSITSQISTKESVECSNHGVCDYTTGICTCSPNYSSSDGLGSMGTRMDCGIYTSSIHTYTQLNTTYTVNAYGTINVTTENVTVVTKCPFTNNAVCSGQGTCNVTTGLCTCYSGFGKSTTVRIFPSHVACTYVHTLLYWPLNLYYNVALCK